MRNNTRRLRLFGLFSLSLAILMSISSCGGDDGPTLQEIAEQDLSFTWSAGTAGRITLDGRDVTSFYEDFSITFGIGRYSTRNANGLFQASGIWEWPSSEVDNRIVLDDGKTLSIINLTESRLEFSLAYTGTGGVANSVSGDYRFSLVR